MTENEAMKRMEMCIGISPSENIMSAFKLISEALEEVQQYRAIGTVEECREAVERIKPKKVVITDGHRYNPSGTRRLQYKAYICPQCGEEHPYMEGNNQYHCWKCGQQFNWNSCTDTFCEYYSPAEDCPARNGCVGYRNDRE